MWKGGQNQLIYVYMHVHIDSIPGYVDAGYIQAAQTGYLIVFLNYESI